MNLTWSTSKGAVQFYIPDGLDAVELEEVREVLELLLRRAEKHASATQEAAKDSGGAQAKEGGE